MMNTHRAINEKLSILDRKVWKPDWLDTAANKINKFHDIVMNCSVRPIHGSQRQNFLKAIRPQ